MLCSPLHLIFFSCSLLDSFWLARACIRKQVWHMELDQVIGARGNIELDSQLLILHGDWLCVLWLYQCYMWWMYEVWQYEIIPLGYILESYFQLGLLRISICLTCFIDLENHCYNSGISEISINLINVYAAFFKYEHHAKCEMALNRKWMTEWGQRLTEQNKFYVSRGRATVPFPPMAIAGFLFVFFLRI